LEKSHNQVISGAGLGAIAVKHNVVWCRKNVAAAQKPRGRQRTGAQYSATAAQE